MVQIEELGKVIAQILFNRNNNAARKNPEMIQVVYDSLKLERDLLVSTPPKELRHLLDEEDGCGLQRLEIAVKALIEDSYLQSSPVQQRYLLLKAADILNYLQANDNTFSLERINLLAEINAIIVTFLLTEK